MTIDVHDAIAPLAVDWEALAKWAGAPPFARPGWFSAWWQSFASGELIVVTLTRAGQLAGVLPLRRRAGALASPTNAHTPAFVPLAADASAAAELLAWAYEQQPRRVQLDYVDAGDPAVAELQRAAARSGHRVVCALVLRSPYAVLVPGEDVDRRLGSKAARNLRRNRRRLDDVGHVEVQLEVAPRRLEPLLEEGLRVEASGWKAERGTAIVSSPATLRFYTAVCDWAREAGILRLAFLRLDGRAIAFALALQDGTAFYLLKGGYDPAHRRFAPGKLLFRSLMQHAVASGAQRFELLGNVEPWKLQWTQECHERILVRSYAPTVLGTADCAAQTAYLRYGRPLAKRALARVR